MAVEMITSTVGASMEPERLAELAHIHAVPGVSLAVLAGGEVHAAAAGVLHTGTGVAATTDALFQIGSITKVYTATMLMRLVEQGRTTVDTPVVEVLPEFRVADEDVTRQVTLRHLLAHTSGINGDPEIDAGRGDDCLERFVAGMADVTQCHPLGAIYCYCNAGYSILGRVIERLTGQVWDTALRELVLDPAGLEHSWTLPEDVLRFGAAMGHLTHDGPPAPAPVWGIPRFDGPAGLICATATDVVNFARLHLEAGTSLLADMLHPQIDVPNPQDGTYAGQGLGWALIDWGRPAYGHDGGTIGQGASLRVVPDLGLAVAVLTNSGQPGQFIRAVLAEVAEPFGVTLPASPTPPATPVDVDLERHTGTYERSGMRVDVSIHQGQLRTSVIRTDTYAALQPPHERDLVAVADGRFLEERPPGSGRWTYTVFTTAPDGTAYLYLGPLALPKVGTG